uniref:Shadow of prion protein n=1 Tax=Hucho hucho TaxID=62062 RepID=A0A4W5M478_9TELE
MIGQQKLLLLWAWMMLVAALCPGALCKRGGGFRGWGKGTGVGSKGPPSQNHGSSRQGLKMAGAAAAGALGGAAIGYGLGSLGRPRHGYRGSGYGYNADSSSEDQRFHYPEGQGFHNQSDWRRYRNAAGPGPGPMSNILLTLGSMVPFFLGDWIRGI